MKPLTGVPTDYSQKKNWLALPQGSRLCYMLLSEYMREHTGYYRNMIAAYCLGDSLTKQYLEDSPHVKAAQNADDLGVVTIPSFT